MQAYKTLRYGGVSRLLDKSDRCLLLSDASPHTGPIPHGTGLHRAGRGVSDKNSGLQRCLQVCQIFSKPAQLISDSSQLIREVICGSCNPLGTAPCLGFRSERLEVKSISSYMKVLQKLLTESYSIVDSRDVMHFRPYSQKAD